MSSLISAKMITPCSNIFCWVKSRYIIPFLFKVVCLKLQTPGGKSLRLLLFRPLTQENKSRHYKWKRLHVNVVICQIVEAFSLAETILLLRLLQTFFYVIMVYNLHSRDCQVRKAHERLWCLRLEINFSLSKLMERRKNYASEKEWIMHVTFDEGLLSVAADCCRKGRWRNLFQVPKAKYLLPQLIEDRTPTDRSTLTCTEMYVLMKIVLF